MEYTFFFEMKKQSLHVLSTADAEELEEMVAIGSNNPTKKKNPKNPFC